MKTTSTQRLTMISLFVAVVILMKLTGLSSIPVGPLNMTLTMIPIAICAMLMGPTEGAILGVIYGFTSFYDALSGASAMTGFFFQINPWLTFVLCVVLRGLVGFFTGLLFKLYRKADRTNTICYFLGGLTAPLLNTIMFMGFIVLVFYKTDFVQEKIAVLGATGPLMYIALSVGVQGIVEAVSGLVVGGAVCKTLAHVLKINE